MEFDWAAEDVAFRKGLKAFLDQELPEYQEIFDLPPKVRTEFSRSFVKKLAARSWLTPAWPKAYGGRDQSPWQQLIISEEMIAHGEPRTGQYMSVNWVGPAIIRAGTEEQKKLHLTRISNGEVLWCQGFSEPDAGSDLGALRTRAVWDGDAYVINGEKIWTSNAGQADYCFLLARTSTEGAKQAGISIFLIPTNTPGFEIRDVHAVIHEGAFHQCILTNVRAPVEWRLGPENAGFEIVRGLLANERVGVARYHRAAGYLDRFAKIAEERGLLGDSKVIEALSTARAACEAARVLVLRVVDERAHGEQPEMTAYVYRCAAVRAERAVAEVGFEITGAAGLEYRSPADCQFEWAATAGIAGGSYEMNLNSIARFLGISGRH